MLVLCLALPFGLYAAGASDADPAADTPVDINIADAMTLAEVIKGIGPKRAQAVVEYRQVHGPFRSVDELALVKGIGQKTVDGNRAYLMVAPPATD